ncbi:hypothetical protein CRG98_012540 [Punica granatum]|uniref:Integrase catalytic domain-containing protein n=1 Tax=Punica granatum TaxID=22663 RepID=A0A2I0KGX1_PUNGR|nr:hypothetical protein CRG98_012540 [Punica granatum]
MDSRDVGEVQVPIKCTFKFYNPKDKAPLESKSSLRRFEPIRRTSRRARTHILRRRARRGPSSVRDRREFALPRGSPTHFSRAHVRDQCGRQRGAPHFKDRDELRPYTMGSNDQFPNKFSFMDGFSEYNQIRMAEEDKIKTAFTTMWGTFCYRVMPFSLKNAGATYQRAMVTLFHEMMHKEIEVYVDNIIANSKEGEDHLINLKRLFDRLREYKLRLNPTKCTFGAKLGKLLGFVVSERSIEVDPDKVKAIRESPSPSSVREVRGFLGRLNYIARFIANLKDKCQPLFRLVRKNAAIEWDEDCHKAFDTIIAYLIQSPVLVRPTPDRPLILYLTVREQSLGCMLGQEDESAHSEHAIYYLSKKFTEGESNYSKIEKMCCALVWVMQRLRPSSMRNIVKWHCQLTEYDIEYVSRTSVKRQAIADQLVEFPIEYDTPINPTSQTKGSSKWTRRRISLRGKCISTVNFSCTNNVAEYEACILGLQAAIDFKVKELEVFGDSMLTIFQTLGQWKTKDAKLPLEIEIEIEITKDPTYCDAIEATDAKPWYEDIKNFLQTGQYPPFADRRDRKTLRRLAVHYFLSGETLYRRSFYATLLRCIDEHKARPFMEEGIDVIGPINPKASNGHLFILVAIDYFTKWIEAITLASVTAKAVACFLKCDIVACYGVPSTIITDKAKNLNNKIIDELCAQFKILHYNSTPYRPQMNGAVEDANKNIKKIIEKMTVNYKDEMLPYAPSAYRTSIRTSTGATPYSLVYGMEAVLPIEVEIPSMRILAETELEEVEWAKQRYE